MSNAALNWLSAVSSSVLVHGAAFAGLIYALQPDDTPQQPQPTAKMQVQSYQINRVEAPERQPDADESAPQSTAGAALDQGAIPQSAARQAEPQPLAVTASLAPLSKLQTTAAPTTRLAATTAATPVSPAATPVTPSLPATPVMAAVLPEESAKSDPLPQVVAASVPTPAAQPDTATLPEAIPDMDRATATLAVLGAENIADPVSLAAIQSFTAPQTLDNSDPVRDGISGLLAGVPCSRLQVQFDPDTNTLDLGGHVPEDSLRGPVLAALQAQIGADIRVADNLLILPRPQCDALTDISDVGLPQSTDQITNPLLVGEDTQAREFRYAGGEQLILDLTAPDYDAVVYVDYFDADGQVIHLSPNESTPMVVAEAYSLLRIGAETPGAPGLYLTIGPPYGQEIAVAFAASEPLYEGLRPLVEPADAYLAFMAEKVAQARARSSDFKGEWVYFFITTRAQ